MSDWLIFWYEHNGEPALSDYELLLFCSRTPQRGFSLETLVHAFKRKRRSRSA